MQNNVIVSDPDILNSTPVFKGTRVPVQALFDYLQFSTIEEFLIGYPQIDRPKVLTSADYGSPQLRKRIFIIGIKQKIGVPKFPIPIHSSDLSLVEKPYFCQRTNHNASLHLCVLTCHDLQLVLQMAQRLPRPIVCRFIVGHREFIEQIRFKFLK